MTRLRSQALVWTLAAFAAGSVLGCSGASTNAPTDKQFFSDMNAAAANAKNGGNGSRKGLMKAGPGLHGPGASAPGTATGSPSGQ